MVDGGEREQRGPCPLGDRAGDHSRRPHLAIPCWVCSPADPNSVSPGRSEHTRRKNELSEDKEIPLSRIQM